MKLSRRGFTLIEIIVVVAVTMLLSSIVIFYNSSTREQLTLFTEKAKLAEVVLRAKSLAISTYADGSSRCGYGLYLDPAARAYSIISYQPADCRILTSVDPDPAVRVALPNATYVLPPTLALGASSTTSADAVAYVIFIPPDPHVLIARADGSLVPNDQGVLSLYGVRSGTAAGVIVSTAGQITF